MTWPEDVLQRAFPGSVLLDQSTLAGGVSAHAALCTVRLEDGRVIRVVTRRPGAQQGDVKLEHSAQEYGVLAAAKAAGVSSPAPLYLDESSGTLVLKYLEGAPDFAPADIGSFTGQMAGTLARIHRVRLGDADRAHLPDMQARAAEFVLHRPPKPDDSLQEPLVRAALERLWPWERRNPEVLLHGDFWPGNLLWQGGRVTGVIDWEAACRGDPLADVAVARLDLWWAFGRDACDAFTEAYRALGDLDWTDLPRWELWSALRPMSELAQWAEGYALPPISRPDIDLASMTRIHHAFVARALEQLALE